MAVELFTNQASTTVSSGGTTAPAQGTTETWTVASSASFPAISGAQQFHVADPASSTTAAEIIAVTAVSGTTWTVTRGAESTTPVAHAANFTVQQVISAASLSTFAQAGNGDLGGTGAAPTVSKVGGTSFSLPVSLANGGTGQASQQAALDALAGGVTSGQYLRGNGTHVALAAISAADIPDQPWQFRPETYGAKGDGKVIGDGVVNGTTTFTSATAGFTSGDTGKSIMINGGNGTTSPPLITTITFVNSTTVTLGSAASASASGCSAFYATDDTAAVNSAVAAAGTYAKANNYFAEVLFKAKFYGLASGPTQTGNGSSIATFNSQIPLPVPAANGTSQKLVIAFTGAGNSGNTQYWQSTVPNLQGACLVSMVAAPSQPAATFGWQSIVGGPTGTAGLTGGFANVKPVIGGISLWSPALTQQYGFDFRFCAGAQVVSAQTMAFCAVAGNSPKLPDLPGLAFFQSRLSVGLAMPVTGNNDDLVIGSFASEGFNSGMRADDHLTASRVAIIYADAAVVLSGNDGLSSLSNRVSIANLSVEQSNAGLITNGGTIPVDICATFEGINSFDFNDAPNALRGVIRWSNTGGGVPVMNSGGASVKVINDNLGPGHWASPPSVPASTTAQLNTAWRDAWVVIHTGAGVTVSVINIDGTNTGLTMAASSSAAVRVPGAKNITLTYAGGTPTWDWWLD